MPRKKEKFPVLSKKQNGGKQNQSACAAFRQKDEPALAGGCSIKSRRTFRNAIYYNIVNRPCLSLRTRTPYLFFSWIPFLAELRTPQICIQYTPFFAFCQLSVRRFSLFSFCIFSKFFLYFFFRASSKFPFLFEKNVLFSFFLLKICRNSRNFLAFFSQRH